jgi:putative two-component system response regulator
VTDEFVLAGRAPIVLIVDDIQANRELLEGLVRHLGYEVRQAADGIEALEAIAAEEPDLVLLDVDMPRLDGLTVCARLKADPQRRLIPVVLLTAHIDRDLRIRGIEAGADDFLTKPFDAQELLVRCKVLLRDRELNKRLDATEGVLRAFARAVEARDRYTIYHAERVGLYARELGGALGFDERARAVLYDGGVMHDLGKIAIPDAILLKPGPLTTEEYATMQRHSTEGERIVLSLRSTRQFLPIIRHHHERVDGRGYPDHISGRDIPLGARIAAIADAWDAMISDRSYRAGLPEDEARGRLKHGAGTQWDEEYVRHFLELLDGGLVDRVAEVQVRQPMLDVPAAPAD